MSISLYWRKRAQCLILVSVHNRVNTHNSFPESLFRTNNFSTIPVVFVTNRIPYHTFARNKFDVFVIF